MSFRWTAEIEIEDDDGPPLRMAVVGCTLTEALSDRTCAIVDVVSTEHIDFARLLPARSTLTIVPEPGGGLVELVERRFPLVLAKAEHVGMERGAVLHRLTLFDVLYPLGLSKSTRKWRNLRADQIVTRVLD